MSASTITTAFIDQFADDLRQAYQQSASRLRSFTDVQPLAAEFGYFEYIDAVDAYEKTGRAEDVQPVNTNHVRRRCSMKDYLAPDYIDKFDMKRTKVELVNGYVRNLSSALGRKFDDRIITAAFGTAYQGRSGATSVTLPSAQQIAVDFAEGGGGSASNITLGKLRESLEKLEGDEALTPDGMDATGTVVYTANQKHALLKIAEDLKVDNLTTQALAQGADNVVWHGLRFVRVNKDIVPTDGSGYRKVLVFARDAIAVCENANIEVEINYIPEKTSWLINAMGSFDAARVRDNGVVQILCDETKGA